MLPRRLATLGAAACVWLMVQSAAAIPPELSAGKKPTPKDIEVYTLVGAPLAKVFETFQAPIDMTVSDPDTKSPAVCLDYDSYGYVVRDNKVATCIFWANWQATVMGANFKQSYDEILEKLGKPNGTSITVGGPIKLLWTVKDKDRDLELLLDFAKDKKLDRIIVRPPQPPDPRIEEKKRLIEQKREPGKQNQESQKSEESQK